VIWAKEKCSVLEVEVELIGLGNICSLAQGSLLCNSVV